MSETKYTLRTEDSHVPTPAAAETHESINSASSREGASATAVVRVAEIEIPHPHVQWKPLFHQAGLYLGIMHGFRLATEQGTRDGLHNSVIGGYFNALGATHGWSDGDGYYENYLGHPIQGAVSGYMWIHNDPRYRLSDFGWKRDYWMSRLRAMGFMWAFSEQFEVGPISEASIGQIQRYCCEYGFVDHVITPAAGIGWWERTFLISTSFARSKTIPKTQAFGSLRVSL